MINKLSLLLLMVAGAVMYSCSNDSSTTASNGKDSARLAGITDNKYTASLREACEKMAKADNEKDTATFLSLLDSNFSITARGQTFTSLEEFRALAKTWRPSASPNVVARNSYKIEKVEAGSNEPVWAGYEMGTFENVAKSEDGKYSRKVTGPYYRCWRLVDGQWKCYHVVFMAFSCEGDDCGRE